MNPNLTGTVTSTLDTVNNHTAVDDTLGTNGTEHDATYTLNEGQVRIIL